MGTIQLAGPMPAGPAALPTLGGAVHGGQQPVTGAAIQIYAAGSTGYGTGSTSLIAARPSGNQYFAGGQPGCITSQAQVCYPNVVTDSAGSFNITGDYTCPSANSQMYIVATGGNPGATGTNAELAMMTALGPCSALNSSTFITINEVTTVADVTALQQFMSVSNGTPGSFAIGAPSTVYSGVAAGTQGMANAFATANVLAPAATGVSAKTSAVTPESDRIYTLANILSSCVNTTDGGGSNACSSLFAAVKPNALSVAPSDTIQAMNAIATNPVYNVGTIFGLATANQPFAGALAAAPNDYSIALGYSPTYVVNGTTTPAIESPVGVAIDQFGNSWLTSEGLSTFYAVSEVGPTGTLITGRFKLSPSGAPTFAPSKLRGTRPSICPTTHGSRTKAMSVQRAVPSRSFRDLPPPIPGALPAVFQPPQAMPSATWLHLERMQPRSMEATMSTSRIPRPAPSRSRNSPTQAAPSRRPQRPPQGRRRSGLPWI